MNKTHSSKPLCNIISTFVKYASIIFLLFFSGSCGTVQKDTRLISESGIKGFIELNMTASDISHKQIEFRKKTRQISRPGQEIYAIEGMSIEFETLDSTIIRIWFFSNKKEDYKIRMPKDGRNWVLNRIKGEDVVANFGPVKKYFGRNPPKGKKEAEWIKYRPFGIKTNTINYPGLPFHFGLNWDDTLSYITVSRID